MGNAAVDHAAAQVHGPVARRPGVVKPLQLARARIVGEDVAPGAAGVDGAVHDQRRGFLAAGRRVVEVPVQSEPRDVVDVDLRQGAEAVFGVVQAVHNNAYQGVFPAAAFRFTSSRLAV